MSRVQKTSGLIDSVRDRAFVPKEDAVYNDDRIIKILNEQIDTMLLPKLMSINEEHLVDYIDIPTVEGQDRYSVPYRAVGNKLRDVAFLDGDRNFYEMSRISLEELSDYRWNNTYGARDLFYIENSKIVLVSSRSNDYDNIRMWYYLRPNVLVKDSRVPSITSIDRINGIVTLSSFPTHFADTTVYDFIGAKTPNKILKYDVTVTSVNRNARTLIFDPTLIPSDLEVGDLIGAAEESCVPNIPTEYHPVLAQMAAVYILEAMGDTEGLRNAAQKLDRMEKGVMQITDDRVEGAPQKVNPRHSTLTEAYSRGRWKNRRRL